jgi:hypothetical protein
MHHFKKEWTQYLHATEQALTFTKTRPLSSFYFGGLLEKGHAHVALGDFKAAMACYAEIVAHSDDINSYRPNACLSLARLYYHVEHYAAALPLYEESGVYFQKVLGPQHAVTQGIEKCLRICYEATVFPTHRVSWDICKNDRLQCRKCRDHFAVLDKSGRCDVCLLF